MANIGHGQNGAVCKYRCISGPYLYYIKPKNIEFYIDTDETEYFPLPVELRTNIKNLTNFISLMFPQNTIKSINGIKNDKSWSATKALASL